jgi:hypothetical protein
VARAGDRRRIDRALGEGAAAVGARVVEGAQPAVHLDERDGDPVDRHDGRGSGSRRYDRLELDLLHGAGHLAAGWGAAAAASARTV